MNERDQQQPEDLIRNYRQIKAPAHLATRIRAEVSDRPAKTHSWMPVAATLMVAIAAVWLLPFAWQQQSVDTPTPKKPSLSALATLKPDKPSVRAPSLTQLRSVKAPSLPPKPVLRPTKPRSNNFYQIPKLEEKNHAHV